MSNRKFTPLEVYNNRQQLGITNSVHMLIDIINEDNPTPIRMEAIKYLGSIEDISEDVKNECFQTLENILISEDNTELKCQAANCMGKTKLEKSLDPMKWYLENCQADYKTEKAILKAISNIRFEKPEIELFIQYLDSQYNSIKHFVSDQLLKLVPNKAIKILLESFDNDISNICKKEIIMLVGYYIESLNVSFADSSYLKVKQPEIISTLSENIDNFISILSFIDEEDENLMEKIITIFKLLEEKVEEKLISIVEDEDFIAKENAIYLIGKLKLKNAMHLLLKNIDNFYSDISIASIRALANIGDISIIPELLNTLDVEDIEFEYIDIDMKWYIIETIKKIYLNDASVTYDVLIEELEQPNDILKESIAYILGEIGKDEFVDPLLSLLNKKENIDIKKNAIIALGKIGNMNAIDPLLNYIEDSKEYWLLKKIIIDAIFNIFNENWYKIKKDEEIRRFLYKKRAFLMDHLKSKDKECFKVKLGIIKFLEKFGDKSAVDVLFRFVNDFHRIVKISAQNAIKTISKRLEEDNN